jgi:hypothetical protein
MSTQNYASHRRTDPMYHFVLLGLIVLTTGGAVVNLIRSLGDHGRIYLIQSGVDHGRVYSASLILVLTLMVALLAGLCRVYALRAQDRAIRAEENLRHFVLTGKLLDPRIGIRQVIALRFASDEEFAALARRAAEEGLTPDAIKQAVRSWRADNYRV